MRVYTLDSKGLVSAVLMGIAVLLLGSYAGAYFLFLLLLFLMLSALVTELGVWQKKQLGQYERARGWKNVLANGGIAVVLAALFFANGIYHFASAKLLILVYAASISGITADKFASEIGVLDGTPLMLLTMQKVKKGTSGGVTWLGTVSSFVGALIIALTLPIVGIGAFGVAVVAVSGFLGNIVDSLLGYFEEKGVGNKYTSNLACAAASSLIAYLALAAI
ncbi:MAG: DUF92 domain-containing protein [Candidatus Micrarchaeia archaeon]|jgi:uncharacterized protein (TIGR00297 family)